jgi:hypothetical protein
MTGSDLGVRHQASGAHNDQTGALVLYSGLVFFWLLQSTEWRIVPVHLLNSDRMTTPLDASTGCLLLSISFKTPQTQ